MGDKNHPFVGNWTADIAKSKRHPLHQVQSVILKIELAGHALTVAQSVVDESGKETRATMTVYTDGEEHDLGNGHLLVMKWIGPRLLEAVGRKDGRNTGWSQYEVSGDGNCLTFSARSPDETDVSQVIVFDRDSEIPTSPHS